MKKKLLRKELLRKVATLGFVGYLPAPGTCATLCTIPFVFLVRTTGSYYLLWLAVITVFGFIAVQETLKSDFFSATDPSEIVIDEVIGTLITFYSVQLSPLNIIIGFLLFRLLDIKKPWLIKRAETLPGAWGIVADDMLAGFIVHIFLVLIM